MTNALEFGTGCGPRDPATWAFLPEPRRAMARRIILARMAARGNWRYLLEKLQRTAYRFKELENVCGIARTLLRAPNVVDEVCTFNADVLFGIPPVVTFADDADGGMGPTAERWAAIERRSALDILWHNAEYARQFSGGLAWFEVTAGDSGDVCVCARDAIECFPVGRTGPGETPAATERLTEHVFNAGKADERRYLLTERFVPGFIHRGVQRIKPGHKELGPFLDLAEVFGDDAPEDVTETGIDTPTLLYVAGPKVGDVTGAIDAEAKDWSTGGVGDDDDLDQLDDLVFQASGIAYLIAKFVDPTLVTPPMEGESDGVSPITTGGHIESEEPEKIRYLEIASKLESNFKAYEQAVEGYFRAHGINPRLAGLRSDSAAPDAWRKLLLESIPTEMQIRRRGVYWTIGGQRIIDAAMRLDARRNSPLFTPAESTLDVRGGIPETPVDQVERLESEIRAGLTDEQTAREQYHGPEAAAAIAERIEADRAASIARNQAALFGAVGGGFGAGTGGGAAA
ncbi:MAG: hypothetical protein H6826_14370 [Planctomycetes bacterium]|nr:hypothetical protein [Planctomycetota bacterium]